MRRGSERLQADWAKRNLQALSGYRKIDEGWKGNRASLRQSRCVVPYVFRHTTKGVERNMLIGAY